MTGYCRTRLVTPNNLGEEGISSARNATLLRLLEDAPVAGSDGAVCENRGSGISTMLNSLREAGLTAEIRRQNLVVPSCLP